MGDETTVHDEGFMRRAMELAARGRGAVEPNPMVGCVIVREGRVIGEGFHSRFGAPHAEAEALAACAESPAGATVYVNLEPCCHRAKKTPPCVPRLIETGVGRVVVACIDPNPQVGGNGVAELASAGIDVAVGILEAEAKQLNAAFFALMQYGRPYVTLKWAESANGKVAGKPGERLWISNKASQRIVHELRARSDAILVGMNTVLCDDPMLTVRGVNRIRPLLRVVLNRDLTVPLTSRLVQSARQEPLLILCSIAALNTSMERRLALESHGVEVAGLPLDNSSRLDLSHVMRRLGERSVTHLLVEPGPTLAGGFLQYNLADRVWIFRSPKRIEDTTALAAAKVEYRNVGEVMVGGDRLIEYLNEASDVFFAREVSLDFQIAAIDGNPGVE